MNTIICKGGAQRSHWAVSLCFASATLMALEALHPNACAWMGFNVDQSFALSATLATLSIFLGTFVFAKLVSSRGATEQ